MFEGTSLPCLNWLCNIWLHWGMWLDISGTYCTCISPHLCLTQLHVWKKGWCWWWKSCLSCILNVCMVLLLKDARKLSLFLSLSFFLYILILLVNLLWCIRIGETTPQYWWQSKLQRKKTILTQSTLPCSSFPIFVLLSHFLSMFLRYGVHRLEVLYWQCFPLLRRLNKK